VVAVDHPELEAERAFVALGGEKPACLAQLDLWTEAVTDGGFLAEWIDESQRTRARRSWLRMALERMRNEGFHEFLRHLPLARAERMGHFLDQYPPTWHDRAAATVAEAIVEGPGVICPHGPRLLPEAIANRLRRSFVASVGGDQLSVGAAALVPLAITVDDGAEVSIGGALNGPDRGVAINVSTAWLHRVWGAGASLAGGRLVLDRHDRGLTIVTWSDQGGILVPRTMTTGARVGPGDGSSIDEPGDC
jgi:hypothetical protein